MAPPQNNDHYIKLGQAGIHPVEGRQNGLFHTVTLHQSRKQFRIKKETPGIVFQLMAEITITGRRGRRYDGNALRQAGHIEFFVQGEYSLFLKLLQYFMAAARHIA